MRGANPGYRGDGSLSGVVARIRNRPKVAELEQQWRERQRQTRRTAALDRASDPAESLPRPETRARLDTSEDESDNTRAAPARSAGANSEETIRPDDVEDRARDPSADPDPAPRPHRGRAAGMSMSTNPSKTTRPRRSRRSRRRSLVRAIRRRRIHLPPNPALRHLPRR